MTISASQSASREEFERYAKRLGFYGGPTMRDDWDLWQGAWQASRADALEESEQALRWATTLAVSLWSQHYKGTAPHWQPLDTLVGVISQIDNMTTGLTLKEQS